MRKVVWPDEVPTLFLVLEVSTHLDGQPVATCLILTGRYGSAHVGNVARMSDKGIGWRDSVRL